MFRDGSNRRIFFTDNPLNRYTLSQRNAWVQAPWTRLHNIYWKVPFRSIPWPCQNALPPSLLTHQKHNLLFVPKM